LELGPEKQDLAHEIFGLFAGMRWYASGLLEDLLPYLADFLPVQLDGGLSLVINALSYLLQALRLSAQLLLTIPQDLLLKLLH
jgi:hypothetical protein